MAGGFTVPRRLFDLDLSDFEELAGLVVKVKAISTGELLDMDAEVPDLDVGGGWTQGMSSKFEYLIEQFVATLVEWNMNEEDGTPVPATVAGVRSLEIPTTIQIIVSWLTNSAGVSRSEGKASASGVSPEVASLPMETLSESPAS